MKHFCPNVPIILVGNKKDLRNDEHTRRELAKMKQVGFYLSAWRNCQQLKLSWKKGGANSHCHVFRNLSSMKMAKKWPIALVPTVTRSVLQKPKMVWGKSLRWQHGQRCRLKSVARRALAFCYRLWEEQELPLSTRQAQPPSVFGKWEIWGKDPEELNFSPPSYSQQIKVALESFDWILQICHQSLQFVWNNFCLK